MMKPEGRRMPVVVSYRPREKTEQAIFDRMALTETERVLVNDVIASNLEQGRIQFEIIRYICSSTKNPLKVADERDVQRTYSVFKTSKSATVTINDQELATCLFHCKGHNKVLARFAQIQAHLKLLEHPYYMTKRTVEVTYRPPPGSNWLEKKLAPAETESVVEVCLVYNAKDKFSELVKGKWEAIKRASAPSIKVIDDRGTGEDSSEEDEIVL
jgi:hypothetical protein